METWKNLLRKYGSRKFLLSLIGYLTPIFALFNISQSTVETIIMICLAVTSLVAFIIGESRIDVERVKGGKYAETLEKYEKIFEIYGLVDEVRANKNEPK